MAAAHLTRQPQATETAEAAQAAKLVRVLVRVLECLGRVLPVEGHSTVADKVRRLVAAALVAWV